MERVTHLALLHTVCLIDTRVHDILTVQLKDQWLLLFYKTIDGLMCFIDANLGNPCVVTLMAQLIESFLLVIHKP